MIDQMTFTYYMQLRRNHSTMEAARMARDAELGTLVVANIAARRLWDPRKEGAMRRLLEELIAGFEGLRQGEDADYEIDYGEFSGPALLRREKEIEDELYNEAGVTREEFGAWLRSRVSERWIYFGGYGCLPNGPQRRHVIRMPGRGLWEGGLTEQQATECYEILVRLYPEEEVTVEDELGCWVRHRSNGESRRAYADWCRTVKPEDLGVVDEDLLGKFGLGHKEYLEIAQGCGIQVEYDSVYGEFRMQK